jgi:hypothetical protein
LSVLAFTYCTKDNYALSRVFLRDDQATKRGAQAVRNDRKGFARIMWETWSPQGWSTIVTFDRVAASFDNPDWVDVTLHSYRSRWDEAESDPASQWLDDKVKATTDGRRHDQ